MGLTSRLLASLAEGALTLPQHPELLAAAALHSVTLVGSLARADFIEGGSDVDLLLVHGLADGPPEEVGRRPQIRALVHHFGEPLLHLGAGTGRLRPFAVDCHFASTRVLHSQPQWADPASFLREHLSRDRYLWLYAFDLEAHGKVLWGETPAASMRLYPPQQYLHHLVRDLREELARLQSHRVPADLSAAVLAGWKRFAGQLPTLLALCFGPPSLQKRDLYRTFNLSVPYFPGKDFAARLFSEYLYGITYQQDEEWVGRCSQFCANALALLDASV